MICLLAACGSSSEVPPDDTAVETGSLTSESESSEASSASFAPTPIEKQFFDNTTSLLDVFVFQKSLEGPSIFIEHVQTEPHLIDEQLLLFVKELDLLAFLYVGAVSPQGDLLNEFPSCEFGFGENAFNYVARSTNLSGETVTLINGDLCGIVPDLMFEQVDGQAPFDSISFVKDVLVCTNTDSCDQLL